MNKTDNKEQCGFIDILRGPKIFDMSIFDWIGSIIVALLIGYIVLGKRYRKQSWIWAIWLLCWTLFGIIVHYVIGVPTMLGYYIGLNAKPKRKHC